jgi:hypothetical protein
MVLQSGDKRVCQPAQKISLAMCSTHFLQTRKLNMDKDREVDAAIQCYTFENDSMVALPLSTIFSDDGVDTDGNLLTFTLRIIFRM